MSSTSPRLLASAGTLLALSLVSVSPAMAAAPSDPAAPVPGGRPALPVTMDRAGSAFTSLAAPLELDTDGDGTRDTVAYQLTLTPEIEQATRLQVRQTRSSTGTRAPQIALAAATRAQRLALGRQVPGAAALDADLLDRVVADAAQVAVWHQGAPVQPADRPYATAPAGVDPGVLAAVHVAVYRALLAVPVGGAPGSELVATTPAGVVARLIPVAGTAPLTRTVPTLGVALPGGAPAPRATTAPPAAPTTPSAAPTATPTGAPTPAPTSPAPTAAPTPAPTSPPPTAGTPTATPTTAPPTTAPPTAQTPAPTATAPGPTPSAPRRPVSPTLPPASAALQPARQTTVPVPVTVVLPGDATTGPQRRTVLALPYDFDADGDGTRDTTGFTLEPDLPVPTTSSVTLSGIEGWSSNSAPSAVPDPAEWSAIHDRVATLTGLAATADGRAVLLRRAGVDLSAEPAGERDALVLQAVQVAVWQLSSDVRPADDYTYAADPQVPVTGDRAALGRAFRALAGRLAELPVEASGSAEVFRVDLPAASADATAPTVSGGRSAVRAAGAYRAPSLVVGTARPSRVQALAAAPGLPAAPAPSVGALPPVADKYSSCLALKRTDISKQDADYRKALDKDGDGIACESNAQDGPVDLGRPVGAAAAPVAPVVVQAAAAPQSPTVVPTSAAAATASAGGGTGMTCPDYAAQGVTNIASGDPRYTASLDSDADGIGCEAGGEGTAPGQQLAQTGADVATLLGGAGALLAAGVGLVRVGRRRRPAGPR
ncbi:excalibur calcium-binding domain-containing protein [Arsenicicoccus dermatophilus]|uniref:excalibur calcium-binding domain-containing protein n=1 Tax=Arsenicicoccus dermatophilus TaxID=1076331 RepID=UPI0039174616